MSETVSKNIVSWATRDEIECDRKIANWRRSLKEKPRKRHEFLPYLKVQENIVGILR